MGKTGVGKMKDYQEEDRVIRLFLDTIGDCIHWS